LFCTSCGSESAENASFCGKCGTSLAENNETVTMSSQNVSTSSSLDGTSNHDVVAMQNRFAILKVVPEGTPPSDLFPGPTLAPNTLATEPDDGFDMQASTSLALRVRAFRGPGQPSKVILEFRKIQASVFVSDCRVAVACSKYDSGSKLQPLGLGALPVALAYNAVSRSKAAKRRAGNMLVGHVRYPWLISVGFTEKSGMLSTNTLRLGLANPNHPGLKDSLILDIEMPNVNTRELARDVVRRASNYSLTHFDGQMPPERRYHFEELAQGPDVEPVPRGFASYFFLSPPIPESVATVFQGIA